jgi:hypothetical protein
MVSHKVAIEASARTGVSSENLAGEEFTPKPTGLLAVPGRCLAEGSVFLTT